MGVLCRPALAQGASSSKLLDWLCGMRNFANRRQFWHETHFRRGRREATYDQMPQPIGFIAFARRVCRMRIPRASRMHFVLSVILFPMLGAIAVGLFSDSRTSAQQKPTVLQGTWTVTAAPTRVFHGAWSAQILPSSPNAARGSWTLFNDANEMVMSGTWSARKTGQDWQGTWTARTAAGQSFSGTWDADLGGFVGKAIKDMLVRTAEKEVGGSWRSGPYQGNWWLKGSVD